MKTRILFFITVVFCLFSLNFCQSVNKNENGNNGIKEFNKPKK